MRLDVKPAAAAAGAAFLLLLILHLTWPGHGLWLLVLGVLLALTSAALWYHARNAIQSTHLSQHQRAPFADVGAYGLSGANVQAIRQRRTGVPLAAVVAPIAALSILLFIGGAIGSSESQTPEVVSTIQHDVTAIDRSGDTAMQTPQVRPPTAHQTQQTTAPATVTAVTSTSSTTPDAAANTASQSSAPIKPIVVQAPQPASAADEDAEVEEIDPRALTAIEYTVEEGDTLYDIAARYDSTVEGIMDLNKLDAFSFIHPGDVLLIPQVDDEGEES
ncbi:MAG: LysM peptidoglycan-binding domain-containing protein [Chloroflexota bacterium]|nr:LysM peptidoglycan-binding domain-containing protein [Chloroflexota bacterium]